MFLILIEQVNRVKIKQGIDNNWQLRNYFSEQLNSIINGKLNIDPIYGYGECFYVDNLCYGYHGVTPSFIRLPLVLLFGWNGYTDQLIIISVLASIIVSILVVNSVWSIFYKNFENNENYNYSKITYIAVLFSASFGNLAIQSGLPSGYWEALAWSYAFSGLGILFVLFWYQVEKVKHLGISLVCFVLGANSRITVSLISFFIGLTIMNIVKKKIISKYSNLHILMALSISIIPIATGLSIFYLKFGMFIPDFFLNEQIPETPHWASIMQINGQISSSIKFLPSNFLAYFRPDSIVMDGTSALYVRPNLDSFSDIWPIKNGGMHHEPSASVTALVPIFVLMSAVFLFFNLISWKGLIQQIGEKVKLDLDFLRKISVSAITGSIIPLTFVGNSNRYLVDFAIGVVIITTVGAALQDKYLVKDTWSRKFYPFLILGLSLYGCIINLSLEWTNALNY
jgi:hypothetical protein